jgi:hypothetical protein
MNRRNAATLIVVGLASLVLGGAITYLKLKPLSGCPVPNPADHAKYVVFFGDCETNPDPDGRVMIADLPSFKAALATLTPRINTLTEKDSPNATPVPIGPSPLSVADTTIGYIAVTQRRGSGQPCTMHVTQKVGLDNPADVQRLLVLLKPQ